MKDSKKKKLKFIISILFIIIAIIGIFISYRSSYLQTTEIGTDYLDVFYTNVKYKYQVMGFNFILFFIMIYIENKIIKSGLTPFFKDEKKEIPKFANKSIAFILAGVISIIITSLFTDKIILFINSIWIGTTDPIFNLDIGFYLFQKPFIQFVLLYIIGIIIFMTIYMSIYYIAVFNIHLGGIDKELLKKSKFIKQLKLNALLLFIFIAAVIFLNTFNILTDNFISLRDTLSTKLTGAGFTDVTIKLWGYRILSILIIISGILLVKNVNKGNLKKILYPVLIVPGYLVSMFVVMILFNVLYVNNNKLDKEKQYISYNMECTKKAYNLNISEEEIETSEAVTNKDIKENSEIVDNITLVDKDITLKTLNTLQTSSGYYTYKNTRIQKYNIDGAETAVYVSPREISASSDVNTYNNKTFEYTHGYGTIISYTSKFDDAGNIAYVQKNLDASNNAIPVSEPRIYFGLETNNTIITNTNSKTEFDYPLNTTTNAKYSYTGNAGISANFIDRLILSITKKDVNIAFASNLNKDSKVLMNRNIIKRAKTLMPYLVYDENPYLVITDEGKQMWVLDAYTVTDHYPYSQKTLVKLGDSKKDINYIRNSVKVIIDSYNGTIDFYIMDSTDPLIMAYSKVYPTLFKDSKDIPEDIVKHFTYPKYLYDVQSEMLKYYHNITEDVLYRGDDVWNYAKYTSKKVSSVDTTIDSYYTMIKTEDKESKIGLVVPYTVYGKQNIVSYLVGTVSDNGELRLTVNRYSQGSNVIGPTQLEKVIEEDESISKEIQNISVTGTKVTKNLIIVPINNSLLYVLPVYQQQLNQTNSIPLLKKVIVASGNKVAIADNLEEALEKIVSQSATDIKVDNTDTKNDLINTIIDANKNLSESTKANNYEMIGKDITKLQELIKQLEEMQKEDNKNNEIITKNIITDNTIISNNIIQ